MADTVSKATLPKGKVAPFLHLLPKKPVEGFEVRWFQVLTTGSERILELRATFELPPPIPKNEPGSWTVRLESVNGEPTHEVWERVPGWRPASWTYPWDRWNWAFLTREEALQASIERIEARIEQHETEQQRLRRLKDRFAELIALRRSP